MIVILRGTSGSGKTHLASGVMALAGPPNGPELTLAPPGKKAKVAGYTWPTKRFAVVGRYETACGGCDAFSWPGAASDIAALALAQDALGYSVLFEGLMVSAWGNERLLALQKAASGGLTLIHLNTPLETCLASVTERRGARYATKGETAPPLNPKNTTAKHRSLMSGSANNRFVGIKVLSLSREQAAEQLPILLGLK